MTTGSAVPNSPAHHRPNDEPYYIDKTCEDCGAPLRPFCKVMGESELTAWLDEFMCPRCKDGVYLDVPKWTWGRMKDE